MILTAFIGRCPHCGHDHGQNTFDVALGTLTPSEQARLDEQFANYAKQKPHLYGWEVMTFAPFNGPCPVCHAEHTPLKPANAEDSAVYRQIADNFTQGEIATLRKKVEKLEALVVMRCDLEVPPQFSQGLQTHEVLEPVTAEHCQWFVAEIVKLRKERKTHLYLAEQNKQLKAELKSIDGALNDPRANLTLTTAEIIWELKGQVEKLTKERDDLRSRRCEVCGYLEHEREHTGCLREQLAALAEQNEKFRTTLENTFVASHLDSTATIAVWRVKAALSLPDLASPVLNRIRAEGMRMAAEILIDPMDRAAAQKICAQADELEKTNG